MLAIRLKRTSSIEPEYKLVGISVTNNCGINELWHPLIFRRDFHLLDKKMEELYSKMLNYKVNDPVEYLVKMIIEEAKKNE